MTRIDGKAADAPVDSTLQDAGDEPWWRRVPSYLANYIPAPVRTVELLVGGACALILLVMLLAGSGPAAVRVSSGEIAAHGVAEPIIAMIQVSPSDTRSVREICLSEGVPPDLCSISATCAGPENRSQSEERRVVRMFLSAPKAGGCG